MWSGDTWSGDTWSRDTWSGHTHSGCTWRRETNGMLSVNTKEGLCVNDVTVDYDMT